MSSSTGVDGRTYLENLVNVTYKSPGVYPSQYDFYNVLTSGSGAVPNGNGAAAFLSALSSMGNVPYDNSQIPPIIEVNVSDLLQYFYNMANSNTFPNTITDLMNGYVSVVNASLASNGYTTPWSTTANDLVNAFAADYAKALNISSDWGDIVPPLTSADIANQFGAWSSNLLRNLPKPSPVPNDVLNYILTSMSTALTVSAGLTTGVTLNAELTPSALTPIPNQAEMPRYEAVYDLYFPGATHAQYQAVLNQFYQQQVSVNGYFNPSEGLEGWTQKVIQLAVPTQVGLPDITSLASIGSDKTRILNNIYVLIATLLNSIQQIAAVQSNRLNFLTQWQQAYSQSLSTLHSFLSSDNNPVGRSSTDSTVISIRGELNDIINSNYRSLLQNNQSIIGDDSKSLQGNINQAQDEISQQNNRATAIIQELSTMLNAIFK
jgi:hypothetical protein